MGWSGVAKRSRDVWNPGRNVSVMHAGINPFSAQRIHRWVYDFAGEESLLGLSDQFWREVQAGAPRQVLAGPHGSGKSTLLRDLGGYWASRRCQVWWLDAAESGGRVRTWEEVWGDSWGAGERVDSSERERGSAAGRELDVAGWRVVLIDSGERLSWAGRLRLWWRLGRVPTLLTSHRERGERVLYRCRPRLSVFLALCDRLLGEAGLAGQAGWDHATLAGVFAEHGGDMRESFFALYERVVRVGR